MLIDWFTVAAQVVNFLILLVLLKIFLFDRIKRAMARRDDNIQDRFDKAEKQQQEARKEKDRYSQKMQSLEDERDEKMEKADQEAREKRDHLIQEARQEVDTMKKEWRNALEKEKVSFLERFQKQTARVIFDTVEKTLSELADTDAQDQAVKQFLSRFEELDKEKLPDTLEEPPRISTGFELSEKQQTSIQKVLSKKR
jgi:F-type H+-transporting ATPase subunit b